MTVVITEAKLKLYKLYKGDGDMFARTGRKHEKEFMPDSDWHLIDLLLQDATVLSRQLGSENRNAEANRRLVENCENPKVVDSILRLAEKI